MEAFLISTGLVAIAEMGDRTQLLSMLLVSRFGSRPLPILAGILVATLVNHGLSALLGFEAGSSIDPEVTRWIVGLLFIAFAVWALIPDKPGAKERLTERGVFVATSVSFFLAEIGDKTQIATTGLAARFHTVLPVMLGTTLGLLAANAPVVYFGQELAKRLPLRVLRICAAVLFAVVGVMALVGVTVRF